MSKIDMYYISTMACSVVRNMDQIIQLDYQILVNSFQCYIQDRARSMWIVEKVERTSVVAMMLTVAIVLISLNILSYLLQKSEINAAVTIGSNNNINWSKLMLYTIMYYS